MIALFIGCSVTLSTIVPSNEARSRVFSIVVRNSSFLKVSSPHFNLKNKKQKVCLLL